MPDSFIASVTIASVIVFVARVLHARPDDARRERGAQADAGEVGHEPSAGFVEIGHGGIF